jgi:phospholipase/carboxylesterase
MRRALRGRVAWCGRRAILGPGHLVLLAAAIVVLVGWTHDSTRIEALGERASATRGCMSGVHALALGGGRRALMRVTPGGERGRKALIVVLHGAGGSSRDGLYAFRGGWDAPGVALVAPAAHGSTWSRLRGLDTDLPTVTRALDRALARCPVDRRRVAVGGFSDGATYALSLGLEKGDVFKAIMALSPGGLDTQRIVGKPRIFIAHGVDDDVLSFSRTKDLIVPELRGSGYDVTFRTFKGGHKAPAPVSRAAVRWFLGR